ncbi:Uma2 family endonuclease [Longimicrobium sp.]|uniref:Uma2 family endonuclease n=1 Tax=Longimicrobium sp. TaxID=2029185 RepID=UPI002E36C754|nr:Uma2 family endonuclease [Longimicrobium sp.]HEX6042377.1 Uma2 family endonuclease [Longimicrobium sp.]
MTTQSAAVREWTYDEFARLPDDGNRHEVIAGELFVTPPPDSTHQKVSGRLNHLFEGFAEEQDAGITFAAPYAVIFGEGDYVEPDLIFVRRDREEEVIQERGAVAAPDLIIEILSDSTAYRDRGIKRQRYAAYGVPEYWIVDTDARHVEVYRLSGGDLRRVEVADDVVRYQPVPGGPELGIDVPHLLRPVHHRPSRPRRAD